ncbi:MAG TPA: RDD family protein [Candidatus Baltobacteraceae bacterium]|nr:RDD family protein [Candidatus Baltobacteraceae bacterium]
MDRSISVTTPESIAFRYELAGLGSRFLAVAIDFVIQAAIVALIFLGIYLLAMAGGNAPVKDKSPEWTQSIAIAFIAFVIFIVFFGYFILFEALRGGRTPGKQLMGIRVVRDGGYPVDFGSATIRNLVRVVEVAFGCYLLGAISAMISPENKRLGDLAAGTIVVRDARAASLAAIQEASQGEALTMLTKSEHELIDKFVARRAMLAPAQRSLLASRIASRIRPRLSDDLRRLDDEDLLTRLSAW